MISMMDTVSMVSYHCRISSAGMLSASAFLSTTCPSWSRIRYVGIAVSEVRLWNFIVAVNLELSAPGKLTLQTCYQSTHSILGLQIELLLGWSNRAILFAGIWVIREAEILNLRICTGFLADTRRVSSFGILLEFLLSTDCILPYMLGLLGG